MRADVRRTFLWLVRHHSCVHCLDVSFVPMLMAPTHREMFHQRGFGSTARARCNDEIGNQQRDEGHRGVGQGVDAIEHDGERAGQRAEADADDAGRT